MAKSHTAKTLITIGSIILVLLIPQFIIGFIWSISEVDTAATASHSAVKDMVLNGTTFKWSAGIGLVFLMVGLLLGRFSRESKKEGEAEEDKK